jgi:DNA-binding beta-propeller fold protein YncE
LLSFPFILINGTRVAVMRSVMPVRILGSCVFAILMATPMYAAVAETEAAFRYQLSNFSGPVHSQWARLAVDQERNEIYALNQRANDIRIFDEHGMEIFVFGDGYSTAADIAIGSDGDMFILTTGYQTATVHLFNYRGEQVSEIPLRNLPDSFSKFIPDRLVYHKKSLYLVDSDALLVAVVDSRGYFKKGYDLNAAVKPYLSRATDWERPLANTDWKKKQLQNIELTGFAIDGQGNLFFTVPVLFTAFRLAPGGTVQPFGRSGSGPGKFGVVAGIATDQLGYVYVTDRLRSVVLVFDPSLRFQTEFGYRGSQPSSLIVPDDVATDRSGNVYVAQAANRGVSVFSVVHEARGHEPRVRKTNVRKGKRVRATRVPVRDRKVRSSRRSKKETRTTEDVDLTSTAPEESDRIVEEVLPERVEFVEDDGDVPPADLGSSERILEEHESDHGENEDEDQ